MADPYVPTSAPRGPLHNHRVQLVAPDEKENGALGTVVRDNNLSIVIVKWDDPEVVGGFVFRDYLTDVGIVIDEQEYP